MATTLKQLIVQRRFKHPSCASSRAGSRAVTWLLLVVCLSDKGDACQSKFTVILSARVHVKTTHMGYPQSFPGNPDTIIATKTSVLPVLKLYIQVRISVVSVWLCFTKIILPKKTMSACSVNTQSYKQSCSIFRWLLLSEAQVDCIFSCGQHISPLLVATLHGPRW